MAVIGALAAAITTVVAVAIRWLPNSACEEMDRIAFTYWFATVICIGIFAVVAGALGYIILAFRAAPDDADARRRDPARPGLGRERTCPRSAGPGAARSG